jgi:CDP-glucose 4,6-dehydratase
VESRKGTLEKMELKQIEEFYKGKKIFITGHTGFKGTWLLNVLFHFKAILKGYSLKPENENYPFYLLCSNEIQHESFFSDIRNKDILKNEILNFEPDIIFHFAAQPLVRKSYNIPTETFEVNVIGTGNLLESLKDYNRKCTVIIVTTDKVYENKETLYHYKESDKLGGYDPYSASKAACEILINSYRDSFFSRQNYDTHKKAIISLRAGNVIGGGDWSQDRIIPDIIKSISNEKDVSVRNPNSLRPWQHVLEPLVGYLEIALHAHNYYSKLENSYNLGPNKDDVVSVKELVEAAIQRLGQGKWKHQIEIGNHEANLLLLDNSKIKEDIGWSPKLTSLEAINWTIDWYKENQESKLSFTKMQINRYFQL